MTEAVVGGAAITWVDNHCHLDDAAGATIEAARAAGVVKMIDVGCDLASSMSCIGRAKQHAGVAATAGVHPHEARHGIDGLEDLLTGNQVVAVGECGFDFHYDHSPRDVQRDVFAAQVELANRHELPLVIHTREAWEETFDLLTSQGVPSNTIFHCFTGGVAEAAVCLELGGWLSFSGIVSFKSAADVQAAAVMCPDDRLLVETDSPYLAPVPYRGKPNQPAWVGAVGQALADLRAVDVGEVARITSDNAHVAFPGLATC